MTQTPCLACGRPAREYLMRKDGIWEWFCPEHIELARRDVDEKYVREKARGHRRWLHKQAQTSIFGTDALAGDDPDLR